MFHRVGIQTMIFGSARRRGTLLLGAAMACSLLAGCQDRPRQRPSLERLELTSNTLHVSFSAAIELQHVRVLDSQRQELQTLFTAGRRRDFRLPVGLRPATRYWVEASSVDHTWQAELVVPAPLPPLAALLEAPPGQPAITFESQEAAALVPGGGVLPIGLVIENRQQLAAEYQMLLQPGEGVELESEDPRWQHYENDWQLSGKLELEFDFVQLLARVRLKPGVSEGGLRCDFRQWTTDPALATRRQLQLTLRSATPLAIGGQLEVVDVSFPANPQGDRREEHLGDSVVLPNSTWAWLRGWFRSPGTLFNYYEAYGHQAITLKNHADVPLTLLIESDVTDTASMRPLIEFAPPEWYSQRSAPTVEHLLHVPAGQAATASLPLFVRPEVQPGTYQRRLRLFLLGGQQPVIEVLRPLAVLRGDPIVSAVVLASLVLCGVAWCLAIFGGRRWIQAISIEGLSTIGLLAALHFVASYSAVLVGGVLSALMGPFATFLSGLGNEGVTSLLLATAVTLVPRVGTLALSSITVALLNALFRGQLGVLDLLFVTVSVALGELCLLLAGVTSVGKSAFAAAGAATVSSSAAVTGRSACLRIALAIGVANMAALYAQFCMIEVLHRLFFAAWYVTAVAVLTGLGYGAIGAWLGGRLGGELRRTVR